MTWFKRIKQRNKLRKIDKKLKKAEEEYFYIDAGESIRKENQLKQLSEIFSEFVGQEIICIALI